MQTRKVILLSCHASPFCPFCRIYQTCLLGIISLTLKQKNHVSKTWDKNLRLYIDYVCRNWRHCHYASPICPWGGDSTSHANEALLWHWPCTAGPGHCKWELDVLSCHKTSADISTVNWACCFMNIWLLFGLFPSIYIKALCLPKLFKWFWLVA